MEKRVERPIDKEDIRRIEKIRHMARVAVRCELKDLTDIPPELFRIKHEGCDILKKVTGVVKILGEGEEQRRSPVFRLECEVHSELSRRFYIVDGEEFIVVPVR